MQGFPVALAGRDMGRVGIRKLITTSESSVAIEEKLPASSTRVGELLHCKFDEATERHINIKAY